MTVLGQYVIGDGYQLVCKPIKKLGMELFAIILVNQLGYEKIIGTFMSKEMAVTKLDWLLRLSVTELINKYQG